MKTRHDIEYRSAPYGKIATIPAGTPVAEATALPQHDGRKRYWAEQWEGMSEGAAAWQRNYGFLLEQEEVEE